MKRLVHLCRCRGGTLYTMPSKGGTWKEPPHTPLPPPSSLLRVFSCLSQAISAVVAKYLGLGNLWQQKFVAHSYEARPGMVDSSTFSIWRGPVPHRCYLLFVLTCRTGEGVSLILPLNTVSPYEVGGCAGTYRPKHHMRSHSRPPSLLVSGLLPMPVSKVEPKENHQPTILASDKKLSSQELE